MGWENRQGGWRRQWEKGEGHDDHKGDTHDERLEGTVWVDGR